MWRYLAVNVGTSQQPGGDRVSTISLLGCNTSVALAMGPTDEEEEDNCTSWDMREQSCLFWEVPLCDANQKTPSKHLSWESVISWRFEPETSHTQGSQQALIKPAGLTCSYSDMVQERMSLTKQNWINKQFILFLPILIISTQYMATLSFIYLLFVFSAIAPTPVGHSLLILEVSISHTSQSVGLLWTSDQPVAETSTWQRTALTTNIHAPGGIWTHNLCRRAAADLRLRLHCHWELHLFTCILFNDTVTKQY